MKRLCCLFVGLAATAVPSEATGAEKPSPVFVRFKVVQPVGERFRVTTGGSTRGVGSDWNLPPIITEVAAGSWGPWVDLSRWSWTPRADRSGGVAEWHTVKLSVACIEPGPPVRGVELGVQLADQPGGEGLVHSFTERTESSMIGFLVPYPLREFAKEFETGSQMTARHLAWAREATNGRPIALKRFRVATAISQYDPALTRRALETIRVLGFNVAGGTDAISTGVLPPDFIRRAGLRPFAATNIDLGNQFHVADPAVAADRWKKFGENVLQPALATEDGRWKYSHLAFFEISDEVAGVAFGDVAAEKVDAWFRDYLHDKGVTDADLGQPVDRVAFPKGDIHAEAMPTRADLPARRLKYHAAKFCQWWSARHLRHASDLIRGTLPGTKASAMPWGHPFFAGRGMNRFMLDYFELGEQRSVDVLDTEDWLGLNHMYGPAYTWTGGQSLGYLDAVARSAIVGRPMALGCFITPSDDRYLRLKAYSGLGQGVKSFYYWNFGPTYLSTENYWSDLRSEYDGIARVNRALEQSEDVLYDAQPVRDPVAILYSVSHDLWHADEEATDPAAFVERRLLWHALRHQHVQPDFLSEEAVAGGRLAGYKALYIADWCVSRRASAAIDEWVRGGGVLYLSAGAATRDEYYEPYTPPFAGLVWPDGAAQRLVSERSPAKRFAGGAVHTYNERTDLPTIKPMARAMVDLGGEAFGLPVLGVRLDLRPGLPEVIARFDDGAPAGAVVRHGRGKVFALGFLPMLAYGQLADFRPTTLQERWPAGPRALAALPLAAAEVQPVARADVPVVEASLLTGPDGSALVLANYTYLAIGALTIDLRLSDPVARAVSTEGSPVRLRRTAGGVRLEVPLESTDILLLPRR